MCSIPQTPSTSSPKFAPDVLLLASEQIYHQLFERHADDPLSQLANHLSFDEIIYQCREYSHTAGVTHPIGRLVKVLFVKHLYNWSLRTTEREVQFDLRVKWFCGYAVHEAAPDHTTIGRFENWVVEKVPRSYFDSILKQVDEAFPSQRQKIQRGDSFAMVADAARENLIELLRHSGRSLLRALANQQGIAYKLLLQTVGREGLYKEKGEQHPSRLTKEEQHAQLTAVVRKVADCVEIAEESSDELVKEWVEIIEKALTDNLRIERDEGGEIISVRRRTKKEDKLGKYRMGSATDPEATYRKHDKQDDLGYNISVLTDDEFVREIRADTGATPDAVPIPQMLKDQREHHDLAPDKLLYDKAAGSGKTMADVYVATDGTTQLVSPMRAYHTRSKQFSPRDFIVTRDPTTVTCPNGVTTERLYRHKAGEGWTARFTHKVCAGCPLRPDCREKPEKETHRDVFISDYRFIEEQARAYEQTDQYQKEMRTRWIVERIIAGLVRYCGARRANGRGLAKADFQAKMAGAVFNAKRLVKKLSQKQKQAPEPSTKGGVGLEGEKMG